MKSLHDMPKASTTWFVVYYLYYKNKFIGNLTWKFISVTNCLYFLYNWNNILTIFFFAYDSSIYVDKLADYSLVKLISKISLNLFYATQIIKFLLNNNALLNQKLQWQINNKFCGLYYIKIGQNTLYILAIKFYIITHKLDIKKQY